MQATANSLRTRIKACAHYCVRHMESAWLIENRPVRHFTPDFNRQLVTDHRTIAAAYCVEAADLASQLHRLESFNKFAQGQGRFPVGNTGNLSQFETNETPAGR